MKLFQFAFCHDYDKKINVLSGLCPEKWSFGANSDNVILKNYIDHTLEKVYEEDKVIEKTEYCASRSRKAAYFLMRLCASYYTERSVFSTASIIQPESVNPLGE